MDNLKAIDLILEIKTPTLKENLTIIKNDLIGKNKLSIENKDELYKAALIVKKLSSQINEIVHATGIINCIQKILEDDEIIESLSLASGAEGDGIDLVTNKRIAEFKFAIWQEGNNANGMRKRQVFADCVNLLLYQTEKEKELYVTSFESVSKFLNSKKAKWKNVLSKSGNLDKKLEEYLLDKKQNFETISEIYNYSNVKIIDVTKYL